MISNWDFHNLNMDFSSMYAGSNHPSDIDMFYLGRDETLIIGEIKNEQGHLKQGQRSLLERLAEGWHGDAIVLVITHSKRFQSGDRTVNVANCFVREIYYKRIHQWTIPKVPTTVGEVIDYYKEAI